MRPVARTGLSGQIIDLLQDEVTSGRWLVGEKIPNETELSALTGASRNTVREAVQALVHTGMLERRQGSGTYVTSSSDLSATLGRCFSKAQIRDVLELRSALEVTAVRLAATRRTAEDVVRLRGRLADWLSLAGNGDVAEAEAIVAFRRALVAACHNAVYLEVYDSILPTFTAQIAKMISQQDRPKFIPEYQALVDAIADKNTELAVQITQKVFAELLDEE